MAVDPAEFRRLRWRCRRGMRELDALLMRWIDERYATADPPLQAAFRTFLTLPDPEILALLTGRARSDDPTIERIVDEVRGQPLS